MQKQAIFQSKLLPYALVAPQLAIVLIFFYWPALQAVIQSFLLQDAFGLSITFVWFDNYIELFRDSAYFEAIVRTFFFSFAIAVSSLSFALLLAVMADKPLRGSMLYRTLLIWPYAVAPPVVGVLWIFMLHPSLGIIARYLRAIGVDWNPLLDGDQAAALIILRPRGSRSPIISCSSSPACKRSRRACSRPPQSTAPVRCGGSGP